jgi:hypothetical protein
MDLTSTFTATIWRMLAWLPGWTLRRFFAARWLADHIAIDVRPRHDPVSILSPELPEIQLWLVARNDGYFTVELDRLTADVAFGAAIIRAIHVQRVELPPGVTREIFCRSPISSEQVIHIRKNRDNLRTSLQVRAEFNSKIHEFSKDTGQLTGINPYINLPH